MKKRIITFLMVILIVFVTVCGHDYSLAAGTPGLKAAVTQENILALLDKYDSDGAYIIRQQIKRGDNITQWWTSNGGTTLTSELDTAVHEECHEYTFNSYTGSNGENIYVGDGKSISIDYTKIFPSKEMSTTIPSSLRTFRYSVYVGSPSENLASNVSGIYGLFNEFTAYCWGMSSEMQMYDYFKTYKATEDMWMPYIQQCVSDKLAYAEFKYYMLKYMIYAKTHYPDIYKAILNNQEFKAAYNIIEKKFATQIETFENQLSDIADMLNEAGTKTVYTGDEFRIYNTQYSYTIYSVTNQDYEVLAKELKKSKYKKLSSQLSSVAVKKTGISSLKNKSGKKLTVSLKKVKGVSGYQIQYSTSSKFTSYKTKNVKKTTATISKLSKGKKYYIRVRSYKTIGGKKFYSSWSKIKSIKITK